MDHDALPETSRAALEAGRDHRRRLQPTRTEARLLVLSCLGAWLVGPAWLALGAPEAIGGLLVVAGILGFWHTVNRVAGRELGRSTRAMYLAWNRDAWAGQVGVFWRTLDPRWYVQVIRATGWNVACTAAALVVGLVWSTAWFLADIT